MEKKQFAQRMSQLRQAKGVSARDMSLSLGQSAGSAEPPVASIGSTTNTSLFAQSAGSLQ